MNRLILILLLSIFNFTNSFSQACGNDSVVAQTYFENDNGDFTRTISIDSFDLTNGKVFNTFIDLINNPVPVRANGNFIRKLISYNSNSDTLEYKEMQGTGSGYTDLNKIEFSYDLNNKPLSRIHSHWNGSAWTISKSEVWTYNGIGQILNYLLSDSTGNIRQKNYSYSGNQQVSLQKQVFTSGNWLNEEQYLITYLPSGSRDSLYIEKWDTGSNLWIDSLEGKYDQTNNLAELIRYMYVPGDTTTYYVDTLNNVLSMIHVTHSGTTETETTNWNYFHEYLKMVYFHVFSTYSYTENYNYTPAGILIRRTASSNSSMSSSGSNSDYDTSGNPLESGSYSSSGVSDRNSRRAYTYSTANGIALSYIPLDDYTLATCQGGSVTAIPLISGSCGPYTINWSPSTGLSSDTVSDPVITFQDSIQYTITITDSTGQSTSTTLIAEPDNKLSISFDTTLCNGCPVILMATPGYTTYRWYKNDTLISTGNQNFIALESGTYRVESFYSCNLISDTVQLTLNGLTRIRGHIYLDMDSDCVFNNADRNLAVYGQSPFMVKLERQSYSVLLNTDTAGYYDIPVDTGNYRISVLNPSSIFEFSCPDSGVSHVYVPTYGDTVSGNDFGLKIKYNCERLRLNVSSTRFRPCNNSTITVNYYNEGSVDEPNPIASLHLPPELINITSSQAFNTLPDNTYQFILPPIPVCGIASFTLSADVICDPTALQNATLCIDADISPVNFCSFEPSVSWDGSYVRVISSCENDSACFTIYNIASAGSDMDLPSDWRLYANNLLIQQGSYQLLSGGDTTLCFPSDGRTFRLEADQTDSFPTNGIPNSNVERCGILQPGSNYYLNYILQSPRDNSLPFHQTYCARVFNSYDPNAKTVIPIGYGTNHIVDPNERITYRIDFQNTGNDTAFIVKIIDNLTFYLDPTSVQMIASSHQYNFSIQNNKLTWLFDEILLPDSNTDETNSHGYIEFSIKVKPITPQGTMINNTANIYFDNNSPINAFASSIRICTPETPVINIFPVTDLCSGIISFTSTQQFPGSNPIIDWYLNGTWFSTNQDTVTFIGVFINDVIFAILKSNSACAISDSIMSNMVQVTGTLPTISYVWPQLISSPAISYLWFLNNQLIAGATSQSYTPTASGNYKVRVTDSTGCIFTSFDFPFVFTGITDNHTGNLKVYPNPSHGKFTVESFSGTKSISVLDVTGRNLVNFATDEKTFTINLSENFSSGIYYLIVRSGEKVSYERIVFQP